MRRWEWRTHSQEVGNFTKEKTDGTWQAISRRWSLWSRKQRCLTDYWEALAFKLGESRTLMRWQQAAFIVRLPPVPSLALFFLIYNLQVVLWVLYCLTLCNTLSCTLKMASVCLPLQCSRIRGYTVQTLCPSAILTVYHTDPFFFSNHFLVLPKQHTHTHEHALRLILYLRFTPVHPTTNILIFGSRFPCFPKFKLFHH